MELHILEHQVWLLSLNHLGLWLRIYLFITPKIVTLWGHGMKQQCGVGCRMQCLGSVGSFEKPRVPVGKLEASPAVALLCP